MMSSGENLATNLSPTTMIDQRWKPDIEHAPNCPRCDSSNTKFCYYNNYSLTQPRYFCKGCRRYWTKGGSLRNVPVGGGCRKNRRGKISRTLTTTSDQKSSSSLSRQFPSNSVRPDLLLDDPMGINGISGHGQLSSSTDNSRSDGSGIDLAVLYAKFSNQGHEQRQFKSTGFTASDELAPVPNYEQNIDQFTGGTMNSEYQPTISGVNCSQIGASHDIPPPTQVQLGHGLPPHELDFNMNPSDTNCGSQLLLADDGVQASSNDLFWSSCITTTMWDQPLQSQYDFVPPPVLLEDSSLLLDQNLMNTNWNMFDSLCFEARS